MNNLRDVLMTIDGRPLKAVIRDLRIDIIKRELALLSYFELEESTQHKSGQGTEEKKEGENLG